MAPKYHSDGVTLELPQLVGVPCDVITLKRFSLLQLPKLYDVQNTFPKRNEEYACTTEIFSKVHTAV